MCMTTLTLKIKLNVTDDQKEIFDNTIRQYTDSFNKVASLGWDKEIKNGVELHKLTYAEERERTDLPSQLVCSARVKATESVKSAFALKKKGEKTNKPKSLRCPIRYDARSCTVKLREGKASIASISGRQQVSFTLPDYYKSRVDWKVCSSELCKSKQGKYFLHVVVETDSPVFEASGKVTGVDLGVNRPAVTSDNKFFGTRYWKEIENRNFRLKRSLQAKGTKSAKRKLKKLSGKVNRFRNDCDHVLSKRIVTSVESGSVVAMEDLTDIRSRVKARKKQRRRIHAWSFNRLKVYVQYKAEMKGVAIEFVDPRYTSQKCSHCGHREKGNRKSQSEFKCKKCGFQHNADLNASKNVRLNYLASIGISEASGLLVNQPIVASHHDSVTSSLL